MWSQFKITIVNVGGAFSYLVAIHDSFQQTLEISKRSFNAFVLIYKQGNENACIDKYNAIKFIFKNQQELKVDINSYSLWGESAGTRIATLVGGVHIIRKWKNTKSWNFGNVIYCDAMMEIFNDLAHGFGLGEGTVTKGWINNIVNFWMKQMK